MRKQRPEATIGDVAAVLDAIAPPAMAQSWDNVGLLAGDPGSPCRSLMLCIDLTPEVLAEAVAARCGCIVAYHPPLFHPIKRLVAGSGETDGIVHQAIAAGIALYSPHTALDAAPGGTNDVIAGFCDLRDIEPFEYTSPDSSQVKIVTFVPRERVDAVCAAMATAGAGRIAGYELCSYRSEGTGTFYGTGATHPRVGEPGRVERVPEVRLEMVARRRVLPEVVNSLLQSHPYEEPAYDVYPLAGTPGFGIGRVGTLPPRTTLGRLATLLKQRTGSTVAAIVGKPSARLTRAAVCVGAAGRLPLERERSAGCDVVITGEIQHHDALRLLRSGRSAVALGHWESERPVLKALAPRISAMLNGLPVKISRKDIGPFKAAWR
jgi:dinuclear metal center YbgI/SA1388 family protein